MKLSDKPNYRKLLEEYIRGKFEMDESTIFLLANHTYV